MTKIRILIADDHTIMRDGLRKILESAGDMEVVAEASNGLEALKRASELKPDVMLLDLSMPKLSGIEVCRRIKKESPATRVLVLSMHEEEEFSLKLVRMGISGYLLKDLAGSQVIEAIRQVYGGRAFFSPQISKMLAESYRGSAGKEEEDPYERLNDREREVLQLIAEGHTNKEIGSILFISPKTVDNHRTNLMRKLNIHSAAGLVRYATKKGLILLFLRIVSQFEVLPPVF